MRLENIIVSYRLMRRATSLGILLQEKEVTYENLSEYPLLEAEFKTIGTEGEMLANKFTKLEITLGIYGAFFKESKRFKTANKYIKQNLVTYCKVKDNY